jgi:large subunit ribosomal protein L25
MGRRQVVSHRFLVSAFAGSNPAVPVKKENIMEQKVISFNIRKERKKGAAKRLRKQGIIPSVIYGHNEPVAISIDKKEFFSNFKTVSESTIITLKSKESSYDVLVKDFQEDIIKDEITHIDFYEIERGKVLKTHIPVHLTGAAVGVKEGGILETLTHEVEIECLPKDLPHDVSVDISELNIGDSIHVSDLPELEGIKYLTPEEHVVCAIVAKAAEVEEVEEGEEEGLEEGEEAAEVAEAAETAEEGKEE